MELNCINLFNREYSDEAEKLLMRDKRIKDLGKGVLTISLNEGDTKPFFVKNDCGWLVKIDCMVESSVKNIWSVKKGTLLTPFDIYSQVTCKGNSLLAHNILNNRLLKKKPNYIRVSTDYFRLIHSLDNRGIERTEMIKWKKDTLKDDFGADFIELIPKYSKFGIFPDNKNYEESKFGKYNQYTPFAHVSANGKVSEKDIPWSMNLIKHLWGEQWELGLIYMKVMYENPTQILPILALVSNERETGKSTFGDWLGILYGDNSCVINPIDISSSFNSSYSTKNIIIIEETKIEKGSDLEKIKTIATQKTITVNTKFMPEYSLPFYGKVLMFSNHEDKFVKIDEEENRYWVLKVPTLKDKANHGILVDLANEVPAFLKFLEDLPDVDFTKSRMVFTQEQINTNILARTKKNSRTGAHKDIEIRLGQEMRDNPTKEFIYFRHEDLHKKYFERGSNYAVSYIQEVLKNEMHLKMDNRTTEPLIGENGERMSQVRCFKIANKYYEPVDHKIMGNDGVPF